MSGDKIFKDRRACIAYVEQEESVSIVSSEDRRLMLEALSQYLPDMDKVHVALGVGGGQDFTLLKNMPRIVRRIGVDYSPDMLELCRVRHPDAELVEDDLRHLGRLKRILQDEGRPVVYTLLTNTLGNFEKSEDRRGVIKTIRSTMKVGDLLVAELYKRPELVAEDPGLIPDYFLETKVMPVDLENGRLSEPVPLIKVEPFNSLVKNPPYAWMLQSQAQQQHYGELRAVQVAAGNFRHAAYNPETGDMVVYRLHENSEGGIFEPVFVSHRWEGKELASAFLDAGLIGYTLNGSASFITFYSPQN